MKNGDYDQDAVSKHEIFLEAAARLKIATDATREDRIQAIQDLEFLNGDQWDTDIKNQRKIDGRPAITINLTQTNVRRIENTLKQQRPRIKCHPVGGGARIEDAETVNGLIRHIETLSNASVAYDTGGGSAIKIGWGYWRIVGEYIDEKSFDQELKIKPIRNTFTVYDDPDAVMPAGEDRRWCILTEMMKRTDYKRLYPQAENSEWKSDAPGDETQGWENKEEIRLAEYYRICEKPDKLYKLVDGSGIYASEYDQHEKLLPGALQLLRDENGNPIYRPTSRRYVEWYRLNGTEVVESRNLPGRYIPIIRCEGNVEDINGRVRRYGMVRDLKDPARMYNYWRTMETERYALAPKAPWVMAEGQADGHPEWDSANQKSYSRLEYKPVTDANGQTLPPPQRQAPIQAEVGMAQAAAGAEHDLSAVAGYMPENPQDRAQVVSGNKYLQRRQGMADLLHWHYYDNQTYSIMMTGVMLLDLMPWYYDTERMQRIIGDDGVPKTITINQKEQTSEGVFALKNNLALGKYDVVMDTGPGYQTKREEGTEALLGLLGTPLAEPITKVGADLIVRNMDFYGADDLADRLVPLNPEGMDETIKQLPKQAQSIVGALQAQLKQAQDTIQQQALELKYKGGIEKMKDDGQTRRTLITATERAHATERMAESDDLNSKRDYEGWMRDVDKRGDTARDVAEINAAAKIITTRQNNEHDAKQAEKLVKAGTQDRAN